jgi:7-cyano-7-deazaguanine synthase
MSSCLVLFSGGKDSATALYWARRNYATTVAVSVHYNGRPQGERLAARRLSEMAGVELIEPELPFLCTGATDRRIAQHDDPEMATRAGGYIPMRNLLFYGAAAYYAEVLGIADIVAGHYRGEGIAYPDASPEFLRLLEGVLAISLQRTYVTPLTAIRIVTPLAGLDDKGVIRLAGELGVPVELSWSCWHDDAVPCGVCFSCEDRARALAK